MISFDIFLAAAALTGVLAGPPSALSPDQGATRTGRSESDRAAMDAQREAARRDREDRRYEEGQEAIEEGAWQRAVTVFTDLAQSKGTRTDAAMYWRAYALDRMGQKAEALAATSELIKSYPKSKWINDAKALELQVRQTSGQPVRPEAEADEELKLLALQGLQHSAPEQAVPMLEKILLGSQSPRMKDRALFVLAQSNSPQARQVLANIARGGGNPDLQRRAIQFLGVNGGRESRELLAQIYESSSDVDTKRRILRAFAMSGERARVLAAATGEKVPELRAEAVQQLGVMGAHEELWQLYQKETSVDVKRRIIRSMQNGGSVDRLIELAKAEQNPELRRDVVRALGVTRSARTADVLLQIYSSDTNVDVRKQVVNALFIQENATALVALARKEQDITLKKEIVSRLSQMRSKVATDYMIEILSK